jgi:hypothetical protein
MAITLQGTNNRILMPDGKYLKGEAGGIRNDWVNLHDGLSITCGSSAVYGAPAYVAFPYTFSQVFHIVVCESGAAGWSDWANVIGAGTASIYGVSNTSGSGFYVTAWALQGGGAVNTKNPSGFGFYWLAWGVANKTISWIPF